MVLEWFKKAFKPKKGMVTSDSGQNAVRIMVNFTGTPKGFLPKAAVSELGLDYVPTDADVMSQIEQGIKAVIPSLATDVFGKDFSRQLTVDIAIKPLSAGRQVTRRAAEYDPILSMENVIVLRIDSVVSTWFFVGVGKSEKLLKEMRIILLHELSHHYDYYFGKWWTKFVGRATAVHARRGLAAASLDRNPSFFIRSVFGRMRIEAVSTLNEHLARGSFPFEPLGVDAISEILESVISALETEPQSKNLNLFFERIEQLIYRTSFMMSYTIFLADHPDLDVWREDLLNAFRTGKNFPEVRQAQDIIRNASDNIKKTKYLDFFDLYEQSAKKVGLKEEELVMTSARARELVKKAREANLRMIHIQMAA
jgi:hypothetical protein